MAKTDFICPHCKQQVRVIPLRGNPNISTFESTSEVPEFEQPVMVRSFWASDAVAYTIAGAFAGLVVLAFSWWYGFGLGWLAAFFAFAVGIGLHVLKIVLYAPPKDADPVPAATTIKVEHWEEGKHILFDELDERISVDELKRVASAILVDGVNWSRPALTKGAKLSQPKFLLLNDEFKRLNYVHKGNGNTHVLSLRGRSFLRKVNEM